MYLGLKKGYCAKPYPTSRDMEVLTLWDYLKLLQTSRAMIFDLREERAQKTEADGKLAVDDWGDPVMRICNDCMNISPGAFETPGVALIKALSITSRGDT